MAIKYDGKFTKEFLRKALNFTEEETKYIMTIQRKFPEIMNKDVDEKGFIVDGEKLCKELGVGDNFNDWLLASRKSKIGKLIKYRCVEKVDYIIDWIFANVVIDNDSVFANVNFTKENVEKMTPQQRSKNEIKNKITLTLDCAKKIAMRQNNEAGDMICDYFILMEKAIRSRIDWIKTRHPEKESYKTMCKALEENYMKLNNNRKPPRDEFVYAKEANMINEILFNRTSKEMKGILEVKHSDLLRDSLVIDTNRVIHELQIINTSNLLDIEKTIEDRYEALEAYVESSYKDFKENFLRVFRKEMMK